MAKILICEDTLPIREALKIQLESLGHEATATEDGQKCVAMAEEGDFDLLFLDVMMPGWDGLTVAKKIDAMNSSIKVVVLSAAGLDELSEFQALDCVHQILRKPWKKNELEMILKILVKE